MPYYRRYRRPYYRRSYRRGGSKVADLGMGLLGMVGGLVFLGQYSAAKSFDLASILTTTLSWLAVLAVFAVIGFLAWKIVQMHKGNRTVTTGVPNAVESAQINSEKHGCKCYMDGLTKGEQEVANILTEELSYKDYFIFKNLTIPSSFNGSSQIDHLVISKFGIFVIESKDYKGWIFGGKDDEKWTQSLPGGKNKYEFHNPIRQNWSHIMSLKELMPFIPELSYISIVVFTDNCELKGPPLENVVRIEKIVETIKKHTEIKLPENELLLVLGKLSFACQTVDITSAQHIENVNAHLAKV